MSTLDDLIFSIQEKDWRDFAHQLSQETDRGTALVAAAFLDDLLGRILESFFGNDREASENLLNGPRAPLGGFISRIYAAYSLGLIHADEKNDLHIIRRIRNKFAHRLENTAFTDEDLVSLINNFITLDKVPKNLVDVKQLELRQAFINVTAMLSTILDERKN
jgi:DNA-binding MltR family transcriptional regulator